MSHYQPNGGRGGGRYGNHSLGRGFGRHARNSNTDFRGGGGRGRGFGRWGGKQADHRGRGRWSGRGRSGHSKNNIRMDRGNLQYRPSAFDPIEEIGEFSCSPCDEGKGSSILVRIAVEGCCHGELDLIYDRLMDHQKTSGRKIDLLICCGDFQSLRNPADFHSSSIPPKFRRLGDFAKYYSGEKVAPILTIFIGGNHEASQPLRELHYGGFVAPNIYYLGAAGVVRYRGIRIAGISGIYKNHDYETGYHEAPPYDHRAVKSVYHVRKIDVERMKLLSAICTAPWDRDQKEKTDKNTLDVFVSHDWPLGIEQHGDTRGLIRKKPFFKAEIERNDLGSPPNRELLDSLKPKHWFSAHLHVKFHATVIHRVSKRIDDRNNDDTDSSAKKEISGAKPSTILPTSSLLKPSQARSKSTVVPPPPPPPLALAPNSIPSITENVPTTNPNTGYTSVPLPFDENNASDTDADTDKVSAASTTTEFHAIESSESRCTNNPIPDLTELMTKFLALDKCLPRRHFLSLLNVRVPNASKTRIGESSLSSANTIDQQNDTSKELEGGEYAITEPTRAVRDSASSDAEQPKTYATEKHHLEYDPEWLAILKQTHHWNTTERRPASRFSATTAEDTVEVYDSIVRYDASWVAKRFKETFRNERKEDDNDARSGQKESEASGTPDLVSAAHHLEIPRDFVPTVPYYTDDAFQDHNGRHSSPPLLPAMGNPQTDRLLRILELNHILTRPYDSDLTPEAISEEWRCNREKQIDRRSHRGIQGKDIVSNFSDHNTRSLVVNDENEIDIDIENEDGDEDRCDDKARHDASAVNQKAATGGDDNEIEIDDIDIEDDEDKLGSASSINQNSEKVSDDTNEIDLDRLDACGGDDSESDAKATVFKKARLED